MRVSYERVPEHVLLAADALIMDSGADANATEVEYPLLRWTVENVATGDTRRLFTEYQFVKTFSLLVHPIPDAFDMPVLEQYIVRLPWRTKRQLGIGNRGTHVSFVDANAGSRFLHKHVDGCSVSVARAVMNVLMGDYVEPLPPAPVRPPQAGEREEEEEYDSAMEVSEPYEEELEQAVPYDDDDDVVIWSDDSEVEVVPQPTAVPPVEELVHVMDDAPAQAEEALAPPPKGEQETPAEEMLYIAEDDAPEGCRLSVERAVMGVRLEDYVEDDAPAPPQGEREPEEDIVVLLVDDMHAPLVVSPPAATEPKDVQQYRQQQMAAVDEEVRASRKRMRDAEDAHEARLAAQVNKGWHRGYQEGRAAGLEYALGDTDLRSMMRRNHPVHTAKATVVSGAVEKDWDWN